MPFFKNLRNSFSLSGIRHIPGPRGLNFVKLMFHFKRDSLGALEETEKQFGSIASYGWPINTIIIYDTKLIKQVLGDRKKIYVKGAQTDEMKVVMGNGLVTNNDRTSWLRSRVIVSKELGPAAITGFSNIILDLSKKTIQKWKDNNSSQLDFSLEMRNLTFAIAGKTLLGSDLTEEDARIVDEAVLYTSKMAHDHMFELFPLPYWVPTKKNKEFHRHNNNLSSIVKRLLIQEKNHSDESKAKSILQRLVYAKNPETGEGLSDQELKDEVITLLIAGYETTSNTLAWIFGLLSKHTDIQNELREEIKNTEEISSINFKNTHPRLYQAIVEGIRLYTTIPMSSRKNLEDDHFGDYKVPKGTSIVIPVWNIHRSEKYWKDALSFNPKRFENVDPNRLDYYLPFSKGERRCVGENFSLIEVAIIVSEVLKEFKLELIGKELPKAVSHVSLKPESGMPIRITRVAP